MIRAALQLGLLRRLDGDQGPYRWWNEQELKEICARMGLRFWQSKRTFRFIFFTVAKPLAGGQ